VAAPSAKQSLLRRLDAGHQSGASAPDWCTRMVYLMMFIAEWFDIRTVIAWIDSPPADVRASVSQRQWVTSAFTPTNT